MEGYAFYRGLARVLLSIFSIENNSSFYKSLIKMFFV